MEFEKAGEYILSRIEAELPPFLYYHSFAHVLDVYKSMLLLAEAEGVGGEDLELLKIAVYYHDCGFVVRLQEHEAAGCDIARNTLPEFGYSYHQIERICGMIMATRLPQSPKNLAEQIICDADLDYLGREDFWSIGNNLYKELSHLDIVKSEQDWNRLQLSFLQNHTYFTKSARQSRQSQKMEHLSKVKQIVESY